MATTVENQVLLLNVRCSFPQLFEPKAVGDGKPRYGVAALMDKSTKEGKANHAKCQAIIDKLTKEKFGGKKLSDANLPLRDGDEKEYDGYEGHWYLSANRAESQGLPTVVDVKRTPLTEKSGKPYAGCYVNLIVRFFTLGGKGDKPSTFGKKICASLEVVQFSRDGEPFGAPRASLDELPDIEDEGEDLSDDDDLGV